MCRPDKNTCYISFLSCNHLSLAVVRTMCCRIICCFVGSWVHVLPSAPILLRLSWPIFAEMSCRCCTAAPSLPFAREVEFACQLPERSCLRVNRGSWCLFKVLVAVQAGNAEEQIFVNGVLFSYLTFSKDKTLSWGVFFIKSSMAV